MKNKNFNHSELERNIKKMEENLKSYDLEVEVNKTLGLSFFVLYYGFRKFCTYSKLKLAYKKYDPKKDITFFCQP